MTLPSGTLGLSQFSVLTEAELLPLGEPRLYFGNINYSQSLAPKAREAAQKVSPIN